jgi:hypothetical protein
MSDAYDYESLKVLAKKLSRRLESLYALDDRNDPFIADMPGRKLIAEWFADRWRELGGEGSQFHMRRIHYRLISSAAPILLPNSTAYENTMSCWQLLLRAGRDARYLGLIPAGSIIDRQNPDPMIFIAGQEATEASIEVSAGLLATSETEVSDPTLYLPAGSVTAPVIPQRYHVEMWCEKSTMNDILVPLGEQLGVNVVTGVGEISLTRVEELIERLRAIGRPVRILYVSDFDPAGLGMPVSVARKIEFMIRNESGHDIQLRWIVLTDGQCVHYQLPRTPLKETERRAGKFEARFGAGATELDALEAIHPGELRRILEREIRRYHDSGLQRRIRKVERKAQDDIDAVHEAVYDRHAGAIAQVKDDYRALLADIGDLRDQIADLQTEFEERAQPVFEAIEAELESELPNAEDYKWPEPKDGDEDDDPLYDSTRDYLDQLDRYHEHQGKSEGGDLVSYDLTCGMCGKTFQSRRRHSKFCSPAHRVQFYRDNNKRP